ncbi:Rossmann-like and DUF2520 domain-containing protein [Coxiella endosymbiont of Amblyomma americanum]|uniref:Rossmann-like and DUF2520 domain-containing protein n=1 Tax=Coxiella endosymbiont of Amblyomma americanum TaxID=325775 RepID=UPI00057E4330|nr:Rossmann-like and DUF2520 domain-containing protein [Coxiella endosymbiont of Amblyomma americanum]AJC50242.1 hypothetical protein Z664_00550 [Coxiella endosymbiont of Amblyomma americanum]AUJ58601.1 hypothetical protein B1F76_00550 [Coxiella-like endosymbiont of Amblyomma americanum]
MSMKINFIGAGRVGKIIAKQIVDNKIALIQGVCNFSLESTEKAITYIGQGMAFRSIQELPPADITFITTHDDEIINCCQNLAKSKNLKKGSIVLHCSGFLLSDVLVSVKKRDCHIASMYPIRSFVIASDINRNSDCVYYCTIEGDDYETLSLLSALFKRINYLVYPIDKRRKSICHIANVFASNYLVTLCDSALSCLKNSGITASDGFKIIINLMKNTLNNLESTQSTKKALTGPISRGDLGIVKNHLQVLSKTNLVELYKMLGLLTLSLTCLPDNKKEEFFQMFILR